MRQVMTGVVFALLLAVLVAPVAQAETWEDWKKSVDRQLKDLEWENEQLKKALDAEESERKEVASEAAELERELEAVKKELEATQAEMAADQTLRDKATDAMKSEMGKIGQQIVKAMDIQEEIDAIKDMKEKYEEFKEYKEEAEKVFNGSKKAWETLKVKQIESMDDLKEQMANLKESYDEFDSEWDTDEDKMKKRLDALEKRMQKVDGMEKGQDEDERTLAEYKKMLDEHKKKISDLELTVKKFQSEDIKQLEGQDKMFGDTLRKHWTDIEELKKWQGQQKTHAAKMVGEELLKSDAFIKRFGERQLSLGFMNSMGTQLTKDRNFLAGLAGNSDFQKSMAYHLSKTHVRTFATGLLKYDDFQKSLEYKLSKSDRFIKAMATSHISVGALGTALANDDRSKKALAIGLAREDYLRYLGEGLAKSSSFSSSISQSSTFLDKLTKSDRFQRGLTDNSSFISKMKTKLK